MQYNCHLLIHHNTCNRTAVLVCILLSYKPKPTRNQSQFRKFVHEQIVGILNIKSSDLIVEIVENSYFAHIFDFKH